MNFQLKKTVEHQLRKIPLTIVSKSIGQITWAKMYTFFSKSTIASPSRQMNDTQGVEVSLLRNQQFRR